MSNATSTESSGIASIACASARTSSARSTTRRTSLPDPERADRTYIEPITVEAAERILAAERPDAVLPTMGGQTALNLAVQLARQGILAKYGTQLIGAQLDAIEKAEDRQRFKDC